MIACDVFGSDVRELLLMYDLFLVVDAFVVCDIFFFSSRRRHTRCSRDWGSDVCSSDLNNSEENLEALGPSPYHVVGSLVPTQHPDLLEVPLDKFQSFQDARLEGVTAFRTSKKVFGRHWTIVATHSQELLEGQLRGIAQVLGKRRRALGELQGKLKRSQEPGAKGKGYTFESLEAHAQNLP